MSFIDPSGKLFQHLDRLVELKQHGMTRAPINVEIDLSNRCSLGCEWCHFAYTHTRGPLKGKRPKPDGATPGGDLMDTGLVFRIVDQLAAAGVRSVTWTGGGEPTLHPDFGLVVEYAAGKLEQGLYTHGGHIDEPLADLLRQHLTFVYVSLDAVDADSYRRAKGVDRFDAACRGVCYLAEADGPSTVGVGFLVTRDNWRDIEPAAKLAEALGADYIQFRPTILYDQDAPDRLAEDTSWMTTARYRLEYVAKRPNVEVDLGRFRGYQFWDGHGYPVCFWSALQVAVTPNGMVWTCVNKREHTGALLGDLSRESFADIWGRHQLEHVGPDCRVMCRGHVANQTLTGLLAERPHAAFV